LTASGICGAMKFDYDIPVNCHVKGNANLLTSMLNNLAKNAILHSHGTTMGLKLVVESKRFYTFSFYDDGIGVKDEELPRLFERFYRIDAGRSRKGGGTGLGLPIVKNTVEAHGGTMSVHNRTNGGLEFVFTLHKYSETAQTKKDTTATPGATGNA
ncbi:MAG: HAMP domain-containing histidine kinase, partial [Paramuribaculum sp.]|nr:HAMP domain-containing histidine kinase [Paramuribaculum sp.]